VSFRISWTTSKGQRYIHALRMALLLARVERSSASQLILHCPLPQIKSFPYRRLALGALQIPFTISPPTFPPSSMPYEYRNH
jgi:hypothetical protein